MQSTTLSQAARKAATEGVRYTPRIKQPGEALPARDDFRKRGRYVPGIDNNMERRVSL